MNWEWLILGLVALGVLDQAIVNICRTFGRRREPR